MDTQHNTRIKAIVDGKQVTFSINTHPAHGGKAYRIIEGGKVIAIHTFPKGFRLQDQKGKTFFVNGHKYTIPH